MIKEWLIIYHQHVFILKLFFNISLTKKKKKNSYTWYSECIASDWVKLIIICEVGQILKHKALLVIYEKIIWFSNNENKYKKKMNINK